jgi:hypothetical protein
MVVLSKPAVKPVQQGYVGRVKPVEDRKGVESVAVLAQVGDKFL